MNWPNLAATSPWRAGLVIVGSVFLGELLLMVALSWTGIEHPVSWLIDACFVAMLSLVLLRHFVLRPLAQSNAQLQSLTHRLVQVQENERRAIARELHDQSSQVLTSLKIGLRQLQREIESNGEPKLDVANLCAMADKVLEDLHRLAMDLRPVTLDHLGLIAALKDHVATFNQLHGIEGRFEAIGFDANVRLTVDLETALFRIVQEALTNVARHAKATRVDLLLNLYPEGVRLTIEDDGIGFDTSISTQSARMGLLGMRERCDMFAGTLTLESTLGYGTTVVVDLPRRKQSRDWQ